MAAQLAALEPQTTSFASTVTAVDGPVVELAETYFFAASGGQPADAGTIADIPVEDVTRTNGTTKHVLTTVPEFDVGEEVSGRIDESFRRYCMRAHTASHAVYGAARQIFDSLNYGGFEITPEKVRIDFDTPRPIGDELLFELERLTNEVIWEDRPVTWESWATDAVKANDEIALNVATEVVETEDTVRIVEIEGWDLAACGGTHVRSTGEIGEVALIDRSNPGEGRTRIEFVVGPHRIDQRDIEKQAAWLASRELGVAIAEVPDRITALQEQLAEYEREVTNRNEQLLHANLAAADAISFEHEGTTWRLATAGEFDTGTVADVLSGVAEDIADIVAVAGTDGRTFLAVQSSSDPAATSIVDTVLEHATTGGGGGSDRSAQAGGLDLTPSEVIEVICDAYQPDRTA